MSTFEVSADHIATLVNIGTALGVASITAWPHAERTVTRNLDLTPGSEDCEWLALELLGENVASCARCACSQRCGCADAVTIGDTFPEFRYVDPNLELRIENVAKAIRYVDCYMYQACESPNWSSSFARAFCKRVHDQLVAKVTAKFAHGVWEYDGPTLLTEQKVNG